MFNCLFYFFVISLLTLVVYSLFSDGEGDWMLEVAVECGSDRDVLDWLHKHFKLNFTRFFHRAAEVEKIEMIKWMISKDRPAEKNDLGRSVSFYWLFTDIKTDFLSS